MSPHLSQRALVTGSRGFTGQYVSAALARAGYQVFGLERETGHARAGAGVDLADYPQVLDVLKAVRPQVVVHLAGLAFVGHSTPDAFYATNLMGTRNLLTALEKTNSGGDGVILASSAGVYGNVRTEEGIGEETPPNPVNEYAVSKLAMEYMARLRLDRLPMVITRPFNYTGVGQSEQYLIPKIVAHFRRREKSIELGNLDIRREFNDVRCVAQTYVDLLRARPWGLTVNICSGKAYSIADVLALCRESTGHALQVIRNDDLARKHEIAVLRGSDSLLRKTVNVRRQIPLKQTLEWMLSA